MVLHKIKYYCLTFHFQLPFGKYIKHTIYISMDDDWDGNGTADYDDGGFAFIIVIPSNVI